MKQKTFRDNIDRFFSFLEESSFTNPESIIYYLHAIESAKLKQPFIVPLSDEVSSGVIYWGIQFEWNEEVNGKSYYLEFEILPTEIKKIRMYGKFPDSETPDGDDGIVITEDELIPSIREFYKLIEELRHIRKELKEKYK